MNPTNSPVSARPTRLALFLGFLEMGLSGFGGVLPWARWVIVDKRRWLDGADFNQALSVGQLLPGPNILNVSVALGYRFHGAIGAVIAFSGLLFAPLVIILLLAALYSQFGELAIVKHVLRGVGAGAAGLLVATAIKMLMALPRRYAQWIVVALAFVGAAILRWPLWWVLAAVAPISVWMNARER
jgi:chromate transporter